jgi:hypothetical protein
VKKSDLQEKLNEALAQQIRLQQYLIDAQNEIITLRKKLEAFTPDNPGDDVYWNVVSGGLTSEDVLAEGDAAKLKRLYEWIFTFGEKYVKPYVHQKTYAEIIAHMTRGLARRMAEADVKHEFGDNVLPQGKTVPFPDISTDSENQIKPAKSSSKKTPKKNTSSKKKRDSSTTESP